MMVLVSGMQSAAELNLIAKTTVSISARHEGVVR